MDISTENMNIIFEALRRAEIYVQQHTGLAVKCKMEVIEKKGSPKELMSVIARELDMDVSNYYIKTRKREVVDMRMLAAYFIRKYYTGHTLHQICGLFGENNLDHTSIVHYTKTVEDLISNPDKPFTAKYRRVNNALQIWIRKN